jgi:uncharacterized phage protein gp47/JayE
MSLETNITQDQLATSRETLRAVLQENDPTLDLSTGGVVDSLLVDGNALAAANSSVEANNIVLSTQLKAIAEGTVTISDEDMDTLMSNYYIVRKEATPATGYVDFIVSENTTYSFQPGYRLRVGSILFKIPTIFFAYPIGTPGVTENDTTVFINQIYDDVTGYLYRFTVPITSVETGPDGLLVTGQELIPDQGFVGLGRVVATTNFSGGTDLETNADLANRALEGLLAYTVGGPDNIQKIVSTAYNQATSGTVGVNDVLMTRDRNNLFNISTGSKVDVYVKSGAIASTGIYVDAVVTDYTTRTARITLTAAQSVGAYRTSVVPYFTSTPPIIISGDVTVTGISHVVATNDLFNPEMPADIDRAFSANQSIEITFTDTRQVSGPTYAVSMTSNGQVISGVYSVSKEYMPGVQEAANAIYDSAARPPGLDVLVKAAVPCIVTVGVVATKPVNYNGPTAEDLSVLVANSINQLPIGTETLDTYLLSSILSTRAPGLVLQSISLQGLIYGQNSVNYTVSQSPQGLTIPTNITAKFAARNTFFTTSSDLVTVTLV